MVFDNLRQILEGNVYMGMATWLRDNYCHYPEFWFVDQLMRGVDHVHYHHEGDVWEHTLLVIKNMSNQQHDYVDMLCALLHDIGKKDALEQNNGKNMHGHEILGVPIARQWMERMGVPADVVDDVCWVIRNHTKANDLVNMKSKYDCWKFVNAPLFYRARRLAVADALGTLDENMMPKMDYEAELAKSVAGTCIRLPMPEPIVTADDLAEYGVGDVGTALCMCHKIQINGGLTIKKSLIKNAIRNLKQRKKP